MATLHVRLFGKFCVQCHEQPLEGFDARKVQELFCYLLLYRDHPHPRETLANLLWNDCSTTQSKTYLRKVLWQLQAALSPLRKCNSSQLLMVESDWVQLNSETDLWLDVAMFEEAFTHVRGMPGTELDLHCVQALQNAVDLYCGDLLEGWYQDWCL